MEKTNFYLSILRGFLRFIQYISKMFFIHLLHYSNGKLIHSIFTDPISQYFLILKIPSEFSWLNINVNFVIRQYLSDIAILILYHITARVYNGILSIKKKMKLGGFF